MDGVRVDSWLESGTEISPYYDSLLGKLMVYAPTRELAVAKIQEALAGRAGGWGEAGRGERSPLSASREGDSNWQRLLSGVSVLRACVAAGACTGDTTLLLRASHICIQKRHPEDRTLPGARGCVC